MHLVFRTIYVSTCPLGCTFVILTDKLGECLKPSQREMANVPRGQPLSMSPPRGAELETPARMHIHATCPSSSVFARSETLLSAPARAVQVPLVMTGGTVCSGRGGVWHCAAQARGLQTKCVQR